MYKYNAGIMSSPDKKYRIVSTDGELMIGTRTRQNNAGMTLDEARQLRCMLALGALQNTQHYDEAALQTLTLRITQIEAILFKAIQAIDIRGNLPKDSHLDEAYQVVITDDFFSEQPISAGLTLEQAHQLQQNWIQEYLLTAQINLNSKGGNLPNWREIVEAVATYVIIAQV